MSNLYTYPTPIKLIIKGTEDFCDVTEGMTVGDLRRTNNNILDSHTCAGRSIYAARSEELSDDTVIAENGQVIYPSITVSLQTASNTETSEPATESVDEITVLPVMSVDTHKLHTPCAKKVLGLLNTGAATLNKYNALKANPKMDENNLAAAITGDALSPVSCVNILRKTSHELPTYAEQLARESTKHDMSQALYDMLPTAVEVFSGKADEDTIKDFIEDLDTVFTA